jgi:hypothetical protein
MASTKTWIVIASGTEPLEEVARHLKQEGFVVQSELEAIGQIVVEGTDEQAKAAEHLKGVTSIQPAHADFNIGQPGSEISW